MLPAILAFLVGFVGWIAASFFGKPLIDFLTLRSEVHEEIIFTGNANPMTVGTTIYTKAQEALRRLGARVQATDVTAPRLLRWFLSKWGYDLTTAGRDLIGLSNSLNLPERHLHVDRIERALKLPPSTAEFLDSTKQQIGRGFSSGS
jgi:hypothetical protein